MSLLSGLFSTLQGRIDHVPGTDIGEVLDTLNAERPGRPPLDEADWRAFESAQVLYTTGRIVRQAMPRQAAPKAPAVPGLMEASGPPPLSFKTETGAPFSGPPMPAEKVTL